MRYLMEDVRAAWKDGLLVLAVWVAAMLIACATATPPPETEPPPEHATDHMMGGPGWRVVDVREAGEQDMKMIEGLAEHVGECLGMPVDLDGYRFFGTNGIIYRVSNRDGTRWQWREAHGLTLWERRWIYVRSELPPLRTKRDVMSTIVHELIHVATKLGHPAVDPIIEECGFETIGGEALFD